MSAADSEARAIVRRVVDRALAERGLEAGTQPARVEPRVRVEVEPPGGAPRPGEPVDGAAGRDDRLVTARCLAGTPDGATYELRPGTLVTPLAEEEARRRGIRLVDRSTGALAGDPPSRLVAVGCDHGGYDLKLALLDLIRALGWQPVDLGTHSKAAVDYPDFAAAVAQAVAEGRCALGIAIDGAGIGSAMAANKVRGIRAAPCTSVELTANAREHNFANVLALGAKAVSLETAEGIVRTFLATPTGEERHARRVAKIAALEARSGPTARAAHWS
jgi:ribose 5-phosphate isomerase B